MLLLNKAEIERAFDWYDYVRDVVEMQEGVLIGRLETCERMLTFLWL